MIGEYVSKLYHIQIHSPEEVYKEIKNNGGD